VDPARRRLAFGLFLQTQLYPAQVRLASTVLMFISLASAWNLIGGFTGYACFGQVGFFGLGGYLTALFMYHLHWGSGWPCRCPRRSPDYSPRW
jgi:branched-chain amino acid transport system permease protein